MAYGASVDGALVSLKPDALQIVPGSNGRSDRMRAVVANDTLHTRVSNGIPVQLSGLFILVSRHMVAGAALRLVRPGYTGWIA